MVTDTIFEEGKFCWRVRSGGGITTQYYSYLLSDGQNLYLSNYADWDRSLEADGTEYIRLTPEGAQRLEEAVSLVLRMTERRLEENAARYRCWSQDGQYSAGWNNDRTVLLVQGPEREESIPLIRGDGGKEQIRKLQWEEDGVLLVHTDSGARLFDPENWILH